MKRGTKLLALLLVLALLSGGALVLSSLHLNDDTGNADEEDAVAIYSAEQSSISRIAWTVGEETHTLVRTENSWRYEEDEALPLDATVTVDMLNALDEILATRTIESPEDLAQYGLAQPELIVDVTAQTQTRFRVGSTTMEGQRYLAMEGDSNVYLVHPAIASVFDLDLYDMVRKEGIPDMSQVEALHVKAETGNYDVVYLEQSGRAYSDSYTWFMETDDGYVTLDTELTAAFLSSVTSVKWSECVNYNADKAALVQYGLDKPTVTYTVDYVQTSGDKTSKDSFTLELGGSSDSETYARIAGSNMVYLVDGSIGDALIRVDAKQLKPDEVILMDWSTVTALDFTVDGVTHRAEKVKLTQTEEDGKTTEKTVWHMNGVETALNIVLPELNRLNSAGYAEAVVPEQEPLLKYVFYRNTENFARVELSIYPYDSTNCLVVLNGESTVFITNAEAEGPVLLAQALVAANQKK